MALLGLQHYSIRTADLEATRAFYVEVLGLEVGPRPPLNFPGYWLTTAGHPSVHLIGMRPAEAGAPPRRASGTGLLDHIAFACSGLAEMKRLLSGRGVEFEERVVPRDGQVQLFLRDPDGVMVELNYPSAEA